MKLKDLINIFENINNFDKYKVGTNKNNLKVYEHWYDVWLDFSFEEMLERHITAFKTTAYQENGECKEKIYILFEEIN